MQRADTLRSIESPRRELRGGRNSLISSRSSPLQPPAAAAKRAAPRTRGSPDRPLVLIAEARGEEAGLPGISGSYRARAKSVGFEGHMAIARGDAVTAAVPRVGRARFAAMVG